MSFLGIMTLDCGKQIMHTCPIFSVYYFPVDTMRLQT